MKHLEKYGGIEYLTFTTPQLAKLINCSKRSILTWIKAGYLTGKWDEKKSRWIVTGKHLARFLYYNPKYRRRVEENNLKGIWGTQKRIILNTVHHKRPAMMDLTDLALKFSVSEDTVRTWLKRKDIRKTRSKFSISTRVYSADAIKKFFDNNPYYQKVYGEQLNKGV